MSCQKRNLLTTLHRSKGLYFFHCSFRPHTHHLLIPCYGENLIHWEIKKSMIWAKYDDGFQGNTTSHTICLDFYNENDKCNIHPKNMREYFVPQNYQTWKWDVLMKFHYSSKLSNPVLLLKMHLK